MKFRMKREDVVKGIVKLGVTGKEFVKQAKEIGLAGSEHAIMECNGKLLEELLAVFDNRFSKALQSWFTQKGVPFVAKEGKLTFSARKAEGIAKDIKAHEGSWTCDPSKLTDADKVILEKICISAIATLNATEWDKPLAASRKESREKAKANPDNVKKRLERALADAKELGLDTSDIIPVAGAVVDIPDNMREIVEMLMPFGENATAMAAIVRAIGLALADVKHAEKEEVNAA